MNVEEARVLATSLMWEHGIAQKGYTFQFDRAVKRFGYCNYKTKTISLSRELTALNDIVEVRDTILHEIAHALAGSRAGHGRVWLSVARGIGYKGGRTHDADVPADKWVGTCPHCGYRLTRMRRNKGACGRCCKRYNKGYWAAEYALVWTPNPDAVGIASNS